MHLSYLPEGNTHPLWPDIERLLQPAAQRGGIDTFEPGDFLFVAVENGAIYAAATVRIAQWEGKDEIDLKLAGGTRFREWMPLLDAELTRWGRDNGAWRLTMRGRKGWARFAKRLGWVVLGLDDAGLTIYEKEL